MIGRTESIWRHLLVLALERDFRRTSISELSRELGLAVSTVHQALERPREIGAMKPASDGGLRLVDPAQLLMLWAGHRRLARDIGYRTHIRLPVVEMEKRLPEGTIPTAFTAYVRHRGGNDIADYDQVVVYGDVARLAEKFPARSGLSNLIVLAPDPLLSRYGCVAPLAQVYVDLFDLPSWAAQRFFSVLSRRLLFIDET